MSAFNTQHFADKLSTLHSTSPPSQIQALAGYLSPLHPHALHITQAWQQQFTSSSPHRQLSLLYLVNELLHTAKRQHQTQLLALLGDVLPPCLLLLWGGSEGDEKVREKVRRVVDVWRERNFFSKEWDDEMRTRVGLPPAARVEKVEKGERKEADKKEKDRAEHKRRRSESELTPGRPPAPPPPAADDPLVLLLSEVQRETVEDSAAYDRVKKARAAGDGQEGEADGEKERKERKDAEDLWMERLRRQLERRERLLLLLHDSINTQQAAIAQIHDRIQEGQLPLQQRSHRPPSHLPTSVLIPLPYVPPSSSSSSPPINLSPPSLSSPLHSPPVSTYSTSRPAPLPPPASPSPSGRGGFGQMAFAHYNTVMHRPMAGAAGAGGGGATFRS